MKRIFLITFLILASIYYSHGQQKSFQFSFKSTADANTYQNKSTLLVDANLLINLDGMVSDRFGKLEIKYIEGDYTVRLHYQIVSVEQYDTATYFTLQDDRNNFYDAALDYNEKDFEKQRFFFQSRKANDEFLVFSNSFYIPK